MVRTRKTIYVGNQEIQRRYIGNKLIFDNLGDKAKVSGEVIFTDKADNSVVHVEVDGKSYQEAGSGKNLSPVNTFTGALDSSKSLQRVIAYNIPIDDTKEYRLSFKSKQGWDGITAFTTNEKVDESITEHDAMYLHAIGLGGKETHSWSVISSGYKYLTITTSAWPLDSGYVGQNVTIYDIQLEEGSVVTEYEPSAVLNPDYPIEIHSLNDFDVVSQKSESGTNNGVGVDGRNLFRDSNFANYNTANDLFTYTSWYDRKGNSYSLNNGVLKMTPIPNVNWRDLSQDILLDDELIAGDVIIFSAYVRTENAGSVMQIGSDHKYKGVLAGGVWANNVVVGTEFQRISVPLAIRGSVDELGFRIGFRNGANQVIEIYQPKLEKGNKATGWTPAPEDITENDNHPLIDKINLLLDEPLRSVGGVKDRLFRDSDGLWKVERNVEVTGTEDGTQLIADAYSPYDVPVTDVLSEEYQNKLSNLRSFQDSNCVYTVVDNTDISPTLHATFKSKGWYDDYKKHY